MTISRSPVCCSFVNEHGREVQLVVRTNKALQVVTINMRGPDSEMHNEITWCEALVLHAALTEAITRERGLIPQSQR